MDQKIVLPIFQCDNILNPSVKRYSCDYLLQGMFCPIPELFCAVQDIFVVFKIPAPPIWYRFQPPVRPGQCTAAGTYGVSIPPEINRRKDCTFKGAGVHEAGQ
jgi:hypothetical protein